MIQAPIFHVNGDDPEAVRPGRAAGLRVPPGVQQGRRHRPGLLPPPRPQRGRRPVVHPAADVRPDRRQALGAQALHRGADRPRRHHPRGGRAGAARLPGPAGAGLRRDPRGASAVARRRHRRRARAAGRAARAGRRAGVGRPRSTLEVRQADRRRAGQPARGLHRPPAAAAAAAAAGARWSTEGGIDWGMGEMLAFGSLLLEGTPGPAGRPGHPPRHLRPAARGAHRPGDRRGVHPAGAPRRGPGAVLRLRLAAVASSRRWASSTATRSPAPTRWCCGRRSSATSSTARRRSSTSSSPRASRSGASAPASCCCCRTATRARARTTPRRRIERFLQLCAEDNMTVAHARDAGVNYFHLLRWQALPRAAPAADRLHARSRCCGSRPRRRAVEEFTTGTFRPVIGDDRRSTRPAVRRVLLCSGKVYYDLRPSGRSASDSDDRDRPGRAALPAARRRARRRRSRRTRDAELRLGAGGAGEPGRVAVHGAQPAGAPRRPRAARRLPRRPSASPAAGSHKMHEVEQRGAGRAGLRR